MAIHLDHFMGGRAGVVEFVPGANGVTVRSTFNAESENPIEQLRQGWQAILKHVEARQ